MTGESPIAMYRTVLYFLLLMSPLVAAVWFAVANYSETPAAAVYETVDAMEGKATPGLAELPVNVWVNIHRIDRSGWRRQLHAGAAYDSKRGTLLVFGSDTHGGNWDNSVHEFDPETLRWEKHYNQSAKSGYRTDQRGYAVAGSGALYPWAMHTYDGVLYDPVRDALLIVARPDHNPIRKQMSGAQHPMWLYDLASREWRILNAPEQGANRFFNAATAYDSRRKIPVAYKWGIWELSGATEQWDSATREHHHTGHYTMEYDSVRGLMAVFGSSKFTNDVWIYDADAQPEQRWSRRTPGGDECPRDQHMPVAFDSKNGVFLLVVDNNEFLMNKWGKRNKAVAETSSTFVYEPDSNRYIRLPAADLPAQGMNYMMVYAQRQQVFLLVTGNAKQPTSVWALRLDMDALQNG